MIVAGVALALTAIQNPDGVAGKIAGESGPAMRIAKVRDRLIPSRLGRPGAGPKPMAAGERALLRR